MTNVTIEGPLLNQGQNCAEILADLPQWFGIDEANRTYADRADELPTFVARQDDELVGFMTLLQHSPQSAELYVLGVRQNLHSLGIGKQLLNASERYLRSQGIQFLQVKTLAAPADDKNYEKTRAFYEGQGYVTLEVIPDLWDEANPCLQMIKRL